MIEDTRLFSANNPIGRMWYYINLVTLGIFVVSVHYGIENYVKPNSNPEYELPIKLIGGFIYTIFILTFLMLVDRRLFDICGSRSSSGYSLLSKMFGLVLLLTVTIYVVLNTVHEASSLMIYLNGICSIFIVVCGIFTFVIGLIPGNSYNEDS